MTPVIPYSISNVSLTPGTVFTRKTYCSTRFSSSKRIAVNTSSSQCLLLPRSALWLLPTYGKRCSLHNKSWIHLATATGTDVAVEEPDTSAADEESTAEAEAKSNTTPAPAKSKRSRPGNKSDMPPVTNEELVVGATFTGKVKSIQPFGAFVDFGAFTDGLVHVSQLSDSFVKEVGSVVSVGQEVTVRLIEANMETGRISLSMRSGDDAGKGQQRKESSGGSERGGPGRKNASKAGQRKGEPKKVSKFVKGQDLEGTVKNMNRAGAFISLPEGEEGFLPISEELDDGFGTMMGETTLEVGQEVSVRVLRISKGQLTLTMKKEEDIPKTNVQVGQGVIHTATNPFLLAFRKNKDIAAFLDEREKVEKEAGLPVEPEVPQEPEKEVVSEAVMDVPEVQDEPITSSEEPVDVPSTTDEAVETDDAPSESAGVEASVVEEASTDVPEIKEEPETNQLPAGTSAVEVQDEPITSSEEPVDVPSTIDEAVETDEAPSESAGVEASAVEEEASTHVPEIKEEPETTISSAASSVSGDVQAPVETVSSEVPSSEESISTEDSAVEEASAVDAVGTEAKSDPPAEPANQIVAAESSTTDEVTEEQTEDATVKDEVPVETPPAETEDPSSTTTESKAVPESSSNGSAASSNDPPSEAVKATISPALVKQLREETGAGMMDCKRALSETEGDIVKAQEYLRKKGLASAEKKASRATAEGRIGSYIHDSRIGVLVEVNCETDFVSRGDIFKELVEDLAMQVAACPQVQYLDPEDVPEEIVSKEREIEMQKEDLLSKPEQIRSKIVEGRIKKRLDELALLEQPYIKNDKVLIKDWVKQTIATIGENIKVRRFVRYTLGEGLEKKSQDFAAEVAAQTAAKPVSIPQPAPAEEAKAPVEKAPTVAVSAALVKQLREETGAGMMDCKKALAETEGDLEKAQEYLRKKGLASADKKSSRLAAEGRIGSYIHDSRIGVLIEVNCETDFVGRSEKFKELVDDLAMQVAACPQVNFVSMEDIAEETVQKEKELEMQREDLQSKPENIREKIVEGRVNKRLGELALLEQPFIKDDSILIKDLVKQTVAALGENIKIRRFTRFTLGETVENAES